MYRTASNRGYKIIFVYQRGDSPALYLFLLKKHISKFHYLTQDLPDRSHVDQVLTACQEGAKWIQYRCFSKSDEQLIEEASQIASICDDWGTTLLITDHYHLLDKADIQGVHIEDMHADLQAIRATIGDDKILGASSHSIEDIFRIAEFGVADYLGCGPYDITYTKITGLPVLGLSGYEQRIDAMNNAGIGIPLIAVGGIKPHDVEALMAIGIAGIAVSSAINMAADASLAYREFHRLVY